MRQHMSPLWCLRAAKRVGHLGVRLSVPSECKRERALKRCHCSINAPVILFRQSFMPTFAIPVPGTIRLLLLLSLPMLLLLQA